MKLLKLVLVYIFQAVILKRNELGPYIFCKNTYDTLFNPSLDGDNLHITDYLQFVYDIVLYAYRMDHLLVVSCTSTLLAKH